MKSLLVVIAVLFVVTLSTGLTTPVSTAAGPEKKERAVTQFNQPVELMGVSLRGEYLFVHDDEAMARGESCTYVYKGQAESIESLVVSFHCTPVERARAATFTVRTLMIAPGRYEITEYQFAGSTESHMVPAHQHWAHVPIAAE